MQLFLPLERICRRVVLNGRHVGLDPSMHHLACVNGVWALRVTLEGTRQLVGQRIKISLGTGDIVQAKRTRDKILQAFQSAGVKIAKNNVWNETEDRGS